MSMNFSNELGRLADPSQYHENVNLESFDKSELLSLFSMMTKIRLAESAIADWVMEGKAKCPCHLAVGQEAIPTGVSFSLNSKDYVFGNHRSHGQYLALDSSLDGLMAEILGKRTGCSGGMGGSMHLISEQTGFVGSVPIVAGTIPVAAGAALAAKMSRKGQVAVSYFGDGATEEGSFHEAMNLATVLHLPILFVGENNLYSSHLDISLRQPSDSIARYAKAHGMRHEVIDGNDVTLVAKTAMEMINSMRDGGGPAFIEAVTYRWFGHVGADVNIDVGVRRSESEILEWKKRDPIRRLQSSFLDSGVATNEELENLERIEKSNVDIAIQKALEAPYPDSATLTDIVYARSSND